MAVGPDMVWSADAYRPPVSPLRAVLTAHLQANWSRTCRESQANGAWVAVLVVALLGLFALLPMLGLAGVLGYGAGKYLGQHPAPLLILGAGLTLAPAFVGLAEGLLMAGRSLPWEAFRVFPLRFRTLVMAEVASGAGSVIFILAGACALVLFGAMAVTRPALAPFALLWWAASGMIHLLAAQLGSGISSLLARNLRFVAFTLLILLSITPALIDNVSKGKKTRGTDIEMAETRRARHEQGEALKRTFEATMVKAGVIAQVLPGTQAVQGSLELVQGTIGMGLLRQLYPLACFGLLALAGARLLAMEERESRRKERGGRRGAKGVEKLWSFASPAVGVARLMGACILKSHLGRLTFLMPVFPLVMIGGPLQKLSQGSQALGIALIYVLLATGSLVYNQFGLDRHGVKALFLMPLRGVDLLKGKALALILHGGLLMGLTVAIAAPLTGATVLGSLSALAMGASVMAVNVMVGQWTSVWQPRALPWDSFNRTNLPFATAMINLGVNGTVGGSLFGVHALLLWIAPTAAFPVMLALAVGLWTLYLKVFLPLLGQNLDKHRERVLHALEA